MDTGKYGWTDGNHHHRQLTEDFLDKTRVSWSSDRKSVLYNTNDGRLFIYDLIKDSITPLNLSVTGMYDAQWSPVDDAISFSLRSTQEQDNNDLWVTNTSKHQLRKVMAQSGVSNMAGWSPDGNQLAYIQSIDRESHHLWQVDLTSNQLEQLTVGSANYYDPAFSPDNRLAFTTNESGNHDIWLFRQDKSRMQITDHEDYDAQPSWSPTGNEIAFYSLREQSRRIWVKNLDDGTLRPITPVNVNSRNPVWFL